MISEMEKAALVRNVKDMYPKLAQGTVIKEQLDRMRLHEESVVKWGMKLGVPLTQLGVHDDSKYTLAEFPHYAKWHVLKDRSDPTGYAMALHHHHNFNEHHPHHWVVRVGWKVRKGVECVNGCYPMPRIFVAEMVADWCAAADVYDGIEGINNEWLIKNFWQLPMHPFTIGLALDMLPSVGGDVKELLRKQPSDVAFGMPSAPVQPWLESPRIVKTRTWQWVPES